MTKNIDRHDKRKEVRRCLGEFVYGCKNREAFEVAALGNRMESCGGYVCNSCIIQNKFNPKEITITGMGTLRSNDMRVWNYLQKREELNRKMGFDKRT